MSSRVIMVTMGKKTKKDKSDVIVKPEDIVTDTVMANAGDSEEDLKKSKKKKKKEKKNEASSDIAGVEMETSDAPEEQTQKSPKGKKKRNADSETLNTENPSPTKKIKQEGGSIVRSAKERMKVFCLQVLIIIFKTFMYFREIMFSYHPSSELFIFLNTN